MTATTSAGTTFAISAGAPATFDAAGYAALSYTSVGEVTSIDGDIGRVYNLITHNPLSSRGTQKYKGSFNEGSFSLALALDYDDTGQDLARTALTSDAAYAFKITLPTGDVIYGQIKVMSFTVNVAGVDNIMAGAINCEITTSSTGVGIVVVES